MTEASSDLRDTEAMVKELHLEDGEVEFQLNIDPFGGGGAVLSPLLELDFPSVLSELPESDFPTGPVDESSSLIGCIELCPFLIDSDPPVTAALPEDLKRKGTANSGDDDEEKQAKSKKARTCSPSRSVHNLSETRRRQNISQKLKTLRELLPSCNSKTNTAVILDCAIECLKSVREREKMTQQNMPQLGLGMGMNRTPMLVSCPFMVQGQSTPNPFNVPYMYRVYNHNGNSPVMYAPYPYPQFPARPHQSPLP